jgi:uracil-DNA glycosylase
MQNKLTSIISEMERFLRTQEKAGLHYVFNSRSSEKAAPPAAATRPDDRRQMLLEELEKKVAVCSRCQLFSTRTRYVFGEGNIHADIVFVGEAPGADEDAQGRPFVGAAGQLLNKIIQSIGVTREKVYICNVLKCRPPQNRNPLPAEIVACKDYVLEQIHLLQPRIICTLGTFATQTLLSTAEGISRLRGRFFDFHGIRLIPTFHPSYLLRDASKKREVWEDMKLIKKELGIA